MSWRLVPSDRLLLSAEDLGTLMAMERENKCADCCPVIGCDTCGRCSDHPVSDGGVLEWVPDSKPADAHPYLTPTTRWEMTRGFGSY